MKQRITIQDIDKPKISKTKEEVRWICNSLGLMRGRDTKDISFKIMCEILDLFSDDKLIPTESIANSLKIGAPRVNHHIRTIMESGIIFRERRMIRLRGGSLSAAIEEMKKDADRIFDDLIEVSERIDKSLKLY